MTEIQNNNRMLAKPDEKILFVGRILESRLPEEESELSVEAVLSPWGVVISPAIGAVFMSLSTVIVAVNAKLLKA